MADQFEVIALKDIPKRVSPRGGPRPSIERERVAALRPGEAIKISVAGLDKEQIELTRQRWRGYASVAFGSGNYGSAIIGDAVYIWRKDAGK